MPTDETMHRRVLDLRNRAYVLQLEAAREYDEGRRRHLLDLVETYQRAADALEPPSPLAQAANALVAHLRKPN